MTPSNRVFKKDEMFSIMRQFYFASGSSYASSYVSSHVHFRSGCSTNICIGVGLSKIWSKYIPVKGMHVPSLKRVCIVDSCESIKCFTLRAKSSVSLKRMPATLPKDENNQHQKLMKNISHSTKKLPKQKFVSSITQSSERFTS